MSTSAEVPVGEHAVTVEVTDRVAVVTINRVEAILAKGPLAVRLAKRSPQFRGR